MSIYDDMRKQNSDDYEAAYISCNKSWDKTKKRGLRSKVCIYDDVGFIKEDFIKVIEEFEKIKNIDIDELIKYWKDCLPKKVDYAEMIGAEGYCYGYEDLDGYFIEDTIAALEELKETRKFVDEIGKEIEKLRETSEIHLREAKLLVNQYEVNINE